MHQSVLAKELIEHLEIKPDDIVIDATINGGGHALQVAEKLNKNGTFIGFDLDRNAIEASKEKLKETKRKKIFINDNFRNLKAKLQEKRINSFNKIYFDLGFSSNQLENPKRGLSYKEDGPLTMTLEENPEDDKLTAHEIVNNWEEENIADIIYGYGGERSARKIAKAIVEKRKEKEIKTTKELTEIIENSLPEIPHLRKVHPARKTFQALRITVNDELGALREVLPQAMNLLEKNGIIAVISFHELEDRIVKNFFKNLKQNNLGEIKTKKPITPSGEESKNNPRARSAKLRVFKKFGSATTEYQKEI